jgi:hypothetical protein
MVSAASRKDLESVGTLLSEVKPESVEWLWPGRLPKGKLSLIEGDPGTGKSTLTIDLAARVSVGGELPDGMGCEAAGVVLVSAEDGPADTIRPRLDAAGADPSKVLALGLVSDAEGHERLLSLPSDVPLLERGIERVGAGLVVIDPLVAFLPKNVDANKDQDVRRALAPLAGLAERTGAAVVAVRHLNKASGGNALYRGGGSIGIVGAARSALLVAKDPQDDARRVLAPQKSNLSQPAPSLAFSLENTANGAVRVAWRGESPLGESELLAAPMEGGGAPPKLRLEASLGSCWIPVRCRPRRCSGRPRRRGSPRRPCGGRRTPWAWSPFARVSPASGVAAGGSGHCRRLRWPKWTDGHLNRQEPLATGIIPLTWAEIPPLI